MSLTERDQQPRRILHRRGHILLPEHGYVCEVVAPAQGLGSGRRGRPRDSNVAAVARPIICRWQARKVRTHNSRMVLAMQVNPSGRLSHLIKSVVWSRRLRFYRPKFPLSVNLEESHTAQLRARW